MGKAMTWIKGVGVGAGMMYLYDPASGSRRRALLRDKSQQIWHQAEHALTATSHDLRNRAQGLAHDVRMVTEEGRLPNQTRDALLALQVRAHLLRATEHPQGIKVHVQDGRAILRGTVLQRDIEDVVAAAATVPGISEVGNQMQVAASPQDVPGIDESVALWLLPAPESAEGRMLLTGSGGALLLWGMLRRGFVGAALSAVGLGLLARGVGGDKLQQLLGQLREEIGLDEERGARQQQQTASRQRSAPRADANQREQAAPPEEPQGAPGAQQNPGGPSPGTRGQRSAQQRGPQPG